MRRLALVAQHPVEARLAADVLSAVGEKRHDLLGRQVAVLGRRRDVEDPPTFRGRETVRRRRRRTLAAVLAASPPPLQRAGRDPALAGGLRAARAGGDRDVDVLEDGAPQRRSVLAPSSSQRALIFPRSTKSAAASASALSFLCS